MKLKSLWTRLTGALPGTSNWVFWYPKAIVKSLNDTSMTSNFARNRFMVAVISLIVMFPTMVFLPKLLLFVLLPQWQWPGAICFSLVGMLVAWGIGMTVAFGNRFPTSVRAGVGAFLVVSFWLTPLTMAVWAILKWIGVW